MIAKLYEGGLNSGDIAERTGLPVSRINDILKSYFDFIDAGGEVDFDCYASEE